MTLEPSDRHLLLVHVTKLEEIAHELSNWVSLAMNYLVRASEDRSRMYDNLATATGLSVRAVGSLRNLMLELAALRRALSKQGSARGEFDTANDAA